MKTKSTIQFEDGSRYGDRELSQLIRRRMMAKTYASRKDYKRSIKHKKKYDDSND